MRGIDQRLCNVALEARQADIEARSQEDSVT
jgi:hypothetical protein